MDDPVFIDLRKYVDVAGREGGDHLFLATQKETRYINCADASLPYYPTLSAMCVSAQKRRWHNRIASR